MNTIELDEIDLSYESYRLRDANRERILLSSISERGVLEPLQGVRDSNSRFLLLDGFKRYRCARKLQIEAIACVVIAEDLAVGIVKLIRTANDLSLHLVEQARLVSDLRDKHKMSVIQIASQVERSPAWVSMRLGLLSEMSTTVRREIFSGGFPARSFMYTVRQFTRVNKVPPKDVDEFVRAVSGKKLSGRQVDQLARGYFQGGEDFREQIRGGNFGWTLNRLEQMDQARGADSVELKQEERMFLKDLEIAQKYEGRVIRHALMEATSSNAFYAEAELVTGGIRRQLEAYRESIGRIYDRCRKAKHNLGSLQAGKEQKGDRATARSGSKDREEDHPVAGPAPRNEAPGQDRARPYAD